MSSNEQTLRDTLAAAAMTGIIAASDDKQPQAEFLARQAWLVADAMLRERTATNHDAASAAKAAELARSPGQSPRGTGGTTPKPVLWLVENSHGDAVDLFDNAANAQRETDRLNIVRLRSDYHAVPLYRDPPPPALTDEEREVLTTVRDIYSSHDDDDSCARIAAVIDGLLARLGGAS